MATHSFRHSASFIGYSSFDIKASDINLLNSYHGTGSSQTSYMLRWHSQQNKMSTVLFLGGRGEIAAKLRLRMILRKSFEEKGGPRTGKVNWSRILGAILQRNPQVMIVQIISSSDTAIKSVFRCFLLQTDLLQKIYDCDLDSSKQIVQQEFQRTRF